MQGMRDCLSELVRRYNQPVSIVGWSLGGMFARMLASETPESIRQVITLASPFRLSSSSQSRAHRAFERYSHLHVKSVMLPTEENPPLAVPATAIYSRLDGIVPWRACLDTLGPQTENIAVYASHMGITHHPPAIYAVADRLAQPVDSWQAFRPPATMRLAFPTPVAAPHQSHLVAA
jgi:pimeloyl-ACP methyl ester carboxylesterase